MEFVCDKLNRKEQTICDNLAAINDHPEEANDALEMVASALNVRMDQLYELFNENRDMLNGICPKLEEILVQLGRLDNKLDDANRKLDLLQTDLLNRVGVLSNISEGHAREFWSKHMRDLVDVRPSVLVDFLEFEYNIGLSKEEVDAFVSLVDKNRDGTISLVEWIEASKQFSSEESFQATIRRYIEERRERTVRIISFEESLRSHLTLLRERSVDNKAGMNFLFG